MRIKHSGQMPTPTNPRHNAAAFHAMATKLAVCGLAKGTSPTTVYPYPVSVTVKRTKRVTTPA